MDRREGALTQEDALILFAFSKAIRIGTRSSFVGSVVFCERYFRSSHDVSWLVIPASLAMSPDGIVRSVLEP